MCDGLEVEARIDGRTTVLALSGELTEHEGPTLEAFYDAFAGDASCVELDLAGITFIDSSGLRALLVVRRRAEDDGRGLRLVRPSRIVETLLEVTGLTTVFDGPLDEGR